MLLCQTLITNPTSTTNPKLDIKLNPDPINYTNSKAKPITICCPQLEVNITTTCKPV